MYTATLPGWCYLYNSITIRLLAITITSGSSSSSSSSLVVAVVVVSSNH